MDDTRKPCALTIAGSDSGGGAGIQADLRTFAAFGVHGLSVIAALTAQNTRGVTAVHVPPIAFLRAQIDTCFDDFVIGAVKLGMLANAEVIHAVADALEFHQPRCIVLDPVMVASSGATLLDPRALNALRARLLPMATVLTPNIPEAELLLGHAINNGADAEAALEQSGADGVMIGRGAYGRPWLIAQVMAALTGRPVPADPTLAQQHALVREHYAMMIDLYGPVIGVNLARKHLGWYTKGLHDSGTFRNQVNQLSDPVNVISMIDSFYAERMQAEALAA